jgi:hypothetical protein
MRYSQAAQRAFCRRQMRRLLELVEGCDDARTVAALLEATTYYLTKVEAPVSGSAGSAISLAKLNRSALH